MLGALTSILQELYQQFKAGGHFLIFMWFYFFGALQNDVCTS